MSSEIFQLRNPGKLCLILKFMLGAVGHLEDLAVCSQVEDSVKEGESLLLMFLEFHSFCYNTTPFPKKINR